MELIIAILVAIIIGLIGYIAITAWNTTKADGVVSKDEFLDELEKELKSASQSIKNTVSHYVDVVKFKIDERKKK